MRMLDCDCGHTLQAANDDELTRAVRELVDQEHPDMDMNDEQLQQLVSDKAYSATDS
jgi:predicted small metal-binding protein